MNKINLAGCAIINDSNEILLLHRIKRDWYELPGGKIDQGETPEETVVRELKEELQCDVEIIRQLGNKDFEEEGHVMGYQWFLSRLKEESEPKIGEPDTFDHFKYIPLSELPNYHLSLNMVNFVKEVFGKGLLTMDSSLLSE